MAYNVRPLHTLELHRLLARDRALAAMPVAKAKGKVLAKAKAKGKVLAKAKGKVLAKAKGKVLAKAKGKGKALAKNKGKVKAKAKGQMGAKASNDMVYKLKQLAKAGRPFPLAKYKTLHSWADKRQFAQDTELDPELTFLQAEEKESASKELENAEVKGACYLWDVARLNNIPWRPKGEDLKSFC